MTDPRYLAVKLLNKTFSGNGYSNLQLNGGLESSDMDTRDKKLCSALYYGVIERKLTLDHIISGLSSRPPEKLDGAVLNILRCGIYQLLYMETIPDSAAVNESVGLAKKFSKTSASGLINAVLRNFLRRGKEIPFPKDPAEAASVKYSAPVELVKALTADYGAELAEDLLSDALTSPPVTIRRNPILCTEDEFLAALGDISAERLYFPENAYTLGGGDIASSEAFKNGLFHVQDIASQLCCMAVAPTAEDRVLDLCAAPGGKTFTMAELMNGKGEIYAFDLHEKRVGLIKKSAERLRLTNIRAAVGDASKYEPQLPEFTKILCDVPCSGLGAIRRKPEIKYKSLADFSALPDVQYRIAENALNYLASGGELVYSTCTLRREENDAVCDRLLENYGDVIEPVELPGILGEKFGCRASIFPCHFGSDGFYIAKFRKRL